MSDRELLQIWRAFRRVTAVVDSRLSVAVAARTLPPQIVDALSLLVGSPTQRLTMSRLAAMLAVTSGGLTKIVDRLVRDDLVHRQHSQTDRRVVFAVLTERGGRVISQALPLHAEQLRAEFGRLSPDRLLALREICRDLLTEGGRRGRA